MTSRSKLSIEEQFSQLGIRGKALIEGVKRSSGTVDTRVAPGVGTNSPTRLETIGARSLGEVAEKLRPKVFVIQGVEMTEDEIAAGLGGSLEEGFTLKKRVVNRLLKLRNAIKRKKNKAKLNARSKIYSRTHKAKISKISKIKRRKFGGEKGLEKIHAQHKVITQGESVSSLGRVNELRKRLEGGVPSEVLVVESPYQEAAIDAGYLIHLIGESIYSVEPTLANSMFDTAETAADFQECLAGIQEGELDGEKLESFTSLIEAAASAQEVFESLGCPCLFEAEDDEEDDDEEDDEDEPVEEGCENEIEEANAELIDKLRADGARDPEALAAWIGTRKHGKGFMQKKAKAARGFNRALSKPKKDQTEDVGGSLSEGLPDFYLNPGIYGGLLWLFLPKKLGVQPQKVGSMNMLDVKKYVDAMDSMRAAMGNDVYLAFSPRAPSSSDATGTELPRDKKQAEKIWKMIEPYLLPGASKTPPKIAVRRD